MCSTDKGQKGAESSLELRSQTVNNTPQATTGVAVAASGFVVVVVVDCFLFCLGSFLFGLGFLVCVCVCIGGPPITWNALARAPPLSTSPAPSVFESRRFGEIQHPSLCPWGLDPQATTGFSHLHALSLDHICLCGFLNHF